MQFLSSFYFIWICKCLKEISRESHLHFSFYRKVGASNRQTAGWPPWSVSHVAPFKNPNRRKIKSTVRSFARDFVFSRWICDNVHGGLEKDEEWYNSRVRKAERKRKIYGKRKDNGPHKRLALLRARPYIASECRSIKLLRIILRATKQLHLARSMLNRNSFEICY